MKNPEFVYVCLDAAREALADVGVAEVLTYQLKRAPDAERRHLILEVLGSLGESGKTYPNCAWTQLSHNHLYGTPCKNAI